MDTAEETGGMNFVAMLLCRNRVLENGGSGYWAEIVNRVEDTRTGFLGHG